MSENKNVVVVWGQNVGEAVVALKQQNLRALNFVEMVQQHMSMLFCGKLYESGTLLVFYGDWLIVDHRLNNPLLQSKTYAGGWRNRLIHHYAMPLTQDYFDSVLLAANSGSELVFRVPRSEAMKALGKHTLKDATKLVLLHALCGGEENAEKFLQDYHKQADRNTICIYFDEKDFERESPVGRVVCCDYYDGVNCDYYLNIGVYFLGVQSTRAEGEDKSSANAVSVSSNLTVTDKEIQAEEKRQNLLIADSTCYRNEDPVSNSCCCFDNDGYDHEGYDSNGFDRDGFDREGLDCHGYNRDRRFVRCPSK